MNQSKDQLPLFPADSHVNLSVLPGSEEARKTTVSSGRRCLESYERLSRPMCWQKMFLASLLLNRAWSSKICLLTWKLQDMKSSRRLLFRLRALVPRISDTESLLLPTPVLSDGGGNRSNPGAKFRPSLRTMASKGLWPTPRAHHGQGKHRGDNKARLEDEVHNPKRTTGFLSDKEYDQIVGQLNPMWEEALMDFRLGWTDVSGGE